MYVSLSWLGYQESVGEKYDTRTVPVRVPGTAQLMGGISFEATVYLEWAILLTTKSTRYRMLKKYSIMQRQQYPNRAEYICPL